MSNGDYGCILALWPLDKPLKLAQSEIPRDKCTRATHPILNRLQTPRKPCTFESRQVSFLLGQWHILKEKNKTNVSCKNERQLYDIIDRKLRKH